MFFTIKQDILQRENKKNVKKNIQIAYATFANYIRRKKIYDLF